MEKLTRGLDSKHVYNFKKSKWFEFYKEHKDDDKLFLGIRNNYVNIYYQRNFDECNDLQKLAFKSEDTKKAMEVLDLI